MEWGGIGDGVTREEIRWGTRRLNSAKCDLRVDKAATVTKNTRFLKYTSISIKNNGKVYESVLIKDDNWRRRENQTIDSFTHVYVNQTGAANEFVPREEASIDTEGK